MRLFIFSMFIFFNLSLIGQRTLRDELFFNADVMITASEVKHRVQASSEFLDLFRSFLEKPESVKDSLEDLKWVSKLSVPGKFRIFTWQINEESKYPCYGFIQMESGEIIELKDSVNPNPDVEFMILSPENWFGHLYYHLEPVSRNFDTIYILFGYDKYSAFNQRKVIETLQFVDDKIVFGNEIFKFPVESSRDLIKTRVGFEYSADAVMSVNYNSEMGLIVFDHLQQVIGQIPGQGPTMVPDGTYEGLRYDGQYWNYKEKLFHEIMDEAPRPKPILDGKKKDIIGRNN